jgi:predicted unusual protein kinase regulating ubiquinone biosynthesis (AarF/ABC1/UbiB family)
VSWLDHVVAVQGELDNAVAQVVGDFSAAIAPEEHAPGPTTLLGRVADLARSDLFAWLEAALHSQEHLSRMAPHRIGRSASLSRGLVMAAVAADLYVGYDTLRLRNRYTPQLVRSRDWGLQHQRGAQRLLHMASSLGGTLIKAGQLASVRGDLLPEEYTHSLATLQDRVPARRWSQIEWTLERELGCPLHKVFAVVERQPVAAASLAQVHRAWLREDGSAVALKVQYPDVPALVAADLAAFGAIVRTLQQLEPGLRLQPIVDHLRATLPLELDFAREAREMSRLRAALSHRSDVMIPSVVPELSTSRLITMEFVEGTKIDDRAGLEQAGINPREVARLVNDVYAEQMLRLGRLHADPHPGNLLVQPGPRLVLLDHGLTFELSPKLVAALRRVLHALVHLDVAALRSSLSEVGFPVTDQTGTVSLLQFAGVLLGGAGGEVGEVGRRLGQAIGDVPVELITIGRALALLAGLTQKLDPHLNVLQIVARHA